MHYLKLWHDAEDAQAAAMSSRARGALEVLPFAGGFYLKQPGSDGVEPRFLCADGRWRRYDAIVDLPHSTAQARLQERLI